MLPSKNERRFFVVCVWIFAGISAVVAIWYALSSDRSDNQIFALSKHQFPVLALTFGPDDKTLTSVAGFLTSPRENVELFVWDVPSRSLIKRECGLQANLTALGLSTDGTTLATTGSSRGPRVWDTASLREKPWEDAMQAGLCCLTLSADGSVIAGASRANEVFVWGQKGTRLWSRPAGHDRFALALSLSPDGRLLASGGSDGAIFLWDLQAARSRQLGAGHASPVQTLTFAPDSRLVATGDYSGVVKLWDSSTDAEMGTIHTAKASSADLLETSEINALAFAPDGKTLAIAVDSQVQCWDAYSRRWQTTFLGNAGKVYSVAYSHDGSMLAFGTQNGTIQVSSHSTPATH